MCEKTLAPSEVVTTEHPKGAKFISIARDAFNKAKLSPEEAQRVNEAAGLAELVGSFINENRHTDRLKNEEVSSNYRYPNEYKGPKPIEEQIKAIAEIFELDPSQALEYAKNLPELPEGAERWFAVPTPEAIARKHFPEITDPAEQYCKAIQFIHEKIKASRAFYNYREGEIMPEHLRMVTRTAEALAKIAEVQKGDILIIAAQLGMRHRGRSVRRARECFAVNEFGLGSLIIGSIALTHPERFVRSDELDIDCAGDEFSPEAVGQFGRAPCFFFYDDRVKFGTSDVDSAYDYFGSASGFLPQ